MRRVIIIALALLVLSLAASAQQAVLGFCTLDHTLDFKTAKAGDKIALHLTRDLVVKGKILMPQGTGLSATVVEVKDGNTVSIVLDKATLKPGEDVPLMGIIAAVATPPGDLTQDPLYSMNHSMEPTQRTGNADAGVATSGAVVQTAILKGGKNDQKSTCRKIQAGRSGSMDSN
jgi:hypothetical protein